MTQPIVSRRFPYTPVLLTRPLALAVHPVLHVCHVSLPHSSRPRHHHCRQGLCGAAGVATVRGAGAGRAAAGAPEAAVAGAPGRGLGWLRDGQGAARAWARAHGWQAKHGCVQVCHTTHPQDTTCLLQMGYLSKHMPSCGNRCG